MFKMPEAEIVLFVAQDIITASNTDSDTETEFEEWN